MCYITYMFKSKCLDKNDEVAESLRCDQASRDFGGTASNPDDVQSIRPPTYKPSEANLAIRKVNTIFLSDLARWILLHTGDGIDRAEIVQKFYGLERLYRGWYVDPCFTAKEIFEHERLNRHAQPRVSMTLKRLEKRGFVRLIRRRRYVKKVLLTAQGKTVVEELKCLQSEIVTTKKESGRAVFKNNDS